MNEKAGNRERGRKCRRFSASYTVEMAYIMAVFCMVMVVLIQQAYRLHDETKSGIKLHEAVEVLRHDEDERDEEINRQAQDSVGHLFSMSGTALEVKRGIFRITGSYSGQERDRAWNLEISGKPYAPEEFLRMMAALKQLEERNERQLQEGNAP